MSYCRVCNEPLDSNCDKLVLYGCPLTDEFVGLGNPKDTLVGDIDIMRCEECGCVQNPESLDYSGYYVNYEYSSALSPFTQGFMQAYAALAIDCFVSLNGRTPRLVIEPGSGDGHQLKFFASRGCSVLGVEPSLQLASSAVQTLSIPTKQALFNTEFSSPMANKADICISSYTLDHCPDPVDYCLAANQILSMNGLCIFEVHDFQKIYERSEYCLFEHEHTIYLTAEKASQIVLACGFEIVALNPLPNDICRANSLIVIAKKVKEMSRLQFKPPSLVPLDMRYKLSDLQLRIEAFIQRVDCWLNQLQGQIVGYGAGGRGVMTLAQLRNYSKFSAILDNNYDGRHVLTPKTLIPVYGPSCFAEYGEASVLVFSFGYYNEIVHNLAALGFSKDKIVSLQEFMDESA